MGFMVLLWSPSAVAPQHNFNIDHTATQWPRWFRARKVGMEQYLLILGLCWKDSYTWHGNTKILIIRRERDGTEIAVYILWFQVIPELSEEFLEDVPM